MNATQLVLLCNCADMGNAQEIAASLVDNSAAACVNIVPGLTSVYRWQGEVRTETEVLLLVKTTAATYDQAEQIIRRLHAYELPEIIAVPITKGSDDYLR
jgi:periplasmic divalent cation tolerance protein